MPTEIKSDLGKICADAEKKAHELVEKTTFDIEEAAKARLYAYPAIDTSILVNSGEHHVEGLEGEVGFSGGHAIYVEFGTGELGAASDFPGKPEDITYTLGGRWETHRVAMEGAEGGGFDQVRVFNKNWKGMAAQPYLIPSVEEQREPFGIAVGGLYG